jgi:hypothetical protein
MPFPGRVVLGAGVPEPQGCSTPLLAPLGVSRARRRPLMAEADLQVFGDRARRCVVEALACYRNDLFLAAANMLGAASEAAWHELADALVATPIASGSPAKELAKASPSITKLQDQTADFDAKFGLPRAVMDTLVKDARHWRRA